VAGDDDEPDLPDVVEVPITDELDLHTFAPREVAALVADYLDECVTRGFTEVRIVHGKGIGALRRTVHAVLSRHPAVAGFALAGGARGGWGATIVRLAPPAGR
jgi:dsDNA-specific endonuclease/ATPase MutS2